jgi:hypothetical protein
MNGLSLSACNSAPITDYRTCIITVGTIIAVVAVAVAIAHIVAHAALVHTLLAAIVGIAAVRADAGAGADAGADRLPADARPPPDSGAAAHTDADSAGADAQKSAHSAASGADSGDTDAENTAPHPVQKRTGGRRAARRDVVKDLAKHPRTSSERQVVEIFEKLTGQKFPTVSPAWLLYNGKQLELDGYCESLKLAVEFSGPLHTKWYPNRETKRQFLERVKRDEAKIRICRENGVKLFVIDMRIPRHHLYTYIKSRLYDAGLGPRPDNYQPEQLYAPDIDYAN